MDPRAHQSRRRFRVVATVLTLVFKLAWPLTQSTIDLQSPWISRVSHFLASGVPSSRGSKSLGFFVGLVLVGSVFFSTACFMDSSRLRITSSLRGFRCAMSLIQTFPSTAPSPSVCPTVLICYGTQLGASTFVRCRGPTSYPKRPGFFTNRSFSTTKWNEEAA